MNVYFEELRTWRITELGGWSMGLQKTFTAPPGIQNMLQEQGKNPLAATRGHEERKLVAKATPS